MKQIIGHKSQIEQLRKAIESKRLPNAYLFVGPKGVGKRLVADCLALSLACLNNKGTWGACGECAGCIKSTNGNHPDQLLVEPSGENIKIDQIRELQSDLRFHSMESAKKIAIVDDADRMTESASNSLLKVLEEPPESTHFVLVSSMSHGLLPTIRSRSQAISFSPLRDGDVAKHIAKGRGISEMDAMRVARFAGGSLGIAMTVDIDFIDEVLNKFITITKKASTADILESSQAWANENP
ncbi:MAG: DNA polymerase III subunit delta', partial [Deltaproteobacteria bacterium]|nr:DNA polymerase III subunit delta' [Deltaproteobacteria bacterium]